MCIYYDDDCLYMLVNIHVKICVYICMYMYANSTRPLLPTKRLPLPLPTKLPVLGSYRSSLCVLIVHVCVRARVCSYM